jgi:SAM-dependent methyltransferase
VARKPYWLDIGAGPNLLIKEQPGADFAVGLDIEKPKGILTSPQESAYCIAPADVLPFKSQTFDFITSRYTFEHLQSPEKTLHEIGRVLKHDGVFVLQTTNTKNPFILLSRLIPFRIKKKLFKRLFRDNPSGIFKTRYKINRPSSIKPAYGPLILKELILVEDILCQSRLLYVVSLGLYKIIKAFGLESLKGNMIAVFQRLGDNP